MTSPFPLGISHDLPWDGYGYFLEHHIMASNGSEDNQQLKENNHARISWLYDCLFSSCVAGMNLKA